MKFNFPIDPWCVIDSFSFPSSTLFEFVWVGKLIKINSMLNEIWKEYIRENNMFKTNLERPDWEGGESILKCLEKNCGCTKWIKFQWENIDLFDPTYAIDSECWQIDIYVFHFWFLVMSIMLSQKKFKHSLVTWHILINHLILVSSVKCNRPKISCFCTLLHTKWALKEKHKDTQKYTYIEV